MHKYRRIVCINCYHQNSIYNTVLTFITTIVGTQVCGAQASNLNLSLYNSNVTFYTENIHLNTLNACYQNYPLSLSPVTIPESQLNTSVSQQYIPTCVGVVFNNDIIVSQITYQINIDVYIDCLGNNLNENVCIDYCTQNPTKCLFSYSNYCFRPNFNIATNNSCKGFIEYYIQKLGPNTVWDSNLSNYCSKYTNFYDFENQTKNSSDRDICACHLSDNLYTNYYNQLLEYFPALSTVSGLDKYCVYPPCATSPYKNLSTGKQCQVPNCINFVGFGPNGNFTKTDVKIGQSCTSGSNTTLYIILGTVIFIFLIALILFIFR